MINFSLTFIIIIKIIFDQLFKRTYSGRSLGSHLLIYMVLFKIFYSDLNRQKFKEAKFIRYRKWGKTQFFLNL